MRILLLVIIPLAIGCSPAAERGAVIESAQVSQTTANVSSTPTETVASSDVEGSTTSGMRSGISPRDVAEWRGAGLPDKIDTLMSNAFSAEGEYVEVDPYY